MAYVDATSSANSAWVMRMYYNTNFNASTGKSTIEFTDFYVHKGAGTSVDSTSGGTVRMWITTSGQGDLYNAYPQLTVPAKGYWSGAVGVNCSYTSLTPNTQYTIVMHWDDPSNNANWDATYTFYITTANYGSYWNDINAYRPDGSTQNGLKFDLVVKNRSGGTTKSWTNLTNEPASSEFTYEWGYTATISNIRTNVTGTHYTYNSIGGSSAGAQSSFSWTFKTANYVVSIYSAWNKYTIAYNANGGSGQPGNQTKTYGTNLTLQSGKPTRVGYKFLGWSTSSSATTATYAAGATLSTDLSTTNGATVTLYAVWEHIKISVKVGDSWKTGDVYINVNGTWKLATAVYVNVNGTWKQMV